MRTTTDICKEFGINKSTLFNWLREFSDFLSDSGNPGPGTTRLFTPADVDILHTIKVLRDERKKYREIQAELAAGYREPYQPDPDPSPAGDEPGINTTALVSRLSASLARAEGELDAIKAERDRVLTDKADIQSRLDTAQAKIDEMHQLILEAEKRATAEATRSEILAAQLDQLNEEKQKDTDTKPVPWWKRWTGG